MPDTHPRAGCASHWYPDCWTPGTWLLPAAGRGSPAPSGCWRCAACPCTREPGQGRQSRIQCLGSPSDIPAWPLPALTVPLMLHWKLGRGKAMALQVRLTTSSWRTYSGELMATIRGFPVGRGHQHPQLLGVLGRQGSLCTQAGSYPRQPQTLSCSAPAPARSGPSLCS